MGGPVRDRLMQQPSTGSNGIETMGGGTLMNAAGGILEPRIVP
jgi:hypothetical protein